MIPILAIDPSLTATGLAYNPGTLPVVTQTLSTKLKGTARLQGFSVSVRHLVHNLEPKVAYIEGYSYASKNGAHHLGELGGVIRLTLFDLGIPLVVVPPSSLKLYATGKGNASKEMMLSAAIQRFGYTGHSNDEADALLLWYLAQHHHTGKPVISVPKVNAGALLKVGD